MRGRIALELLRSRPSSEADNQGFQKLIIARPVSQSVSELCRLIKTVVSKSGMSVDGVSLLVLKEQFVEMICG